MRDPYGPAPCETFVPLWPPPSRRPASLFRCPACSCWRPASSCRCPGQPSLRPWAPWSLCRHYSVHGRQPRAARLTRGATGLLHAQAARQRRLVHDWSLRRRLVRDGNWRRGRRRLVRLNQRCGGDHRLDMTWRRRSFRRSMDRWGRLVSRHVDPSTAWRFSSGLYGSLTRSHPSVVDHAGDTQFDQSAGIVKSTLSVGQVFSYTTAGCDEGVDRRLGVDRFAIQLAADQRAAALRTVLISKLFQFAQEARDC
jgi:hypothetical protein